MRTISPPLPRRIVLSLERPLTEAHRLGSLQNAAGALIGLPAGTARGGVRLARSALTVLLPPATARRRGTCVVCGGSVNEAEPFLRYHGEYYRAHGCAEFNPPALRRAAAAIT